MSAGNIQRKGRQTNDAGKSRQGGPTDTVRSSKAKATKNVAEASSDRPTKTEVKLRQVGGSLMALLPKPAVDEMGLASGQTFALTVDGERIVLTRLRKRRRRYTLDEILASMNPKAPLSEEQREWDEAPRVGDELI